MKLDALVLPVDTVNIGQGFNSGGRRGPSSHKRFTTVDHSHSLDFLGDVGDSVYSTIDGTVLAVVDQYDPIPNVAMYSEEEMLALGDTAYGNYVVVTLLIQRL